jgi:hypothetical protein
MTKFRIDTYQHLVGEMLIYTPHVNYNPFNYKDTAPQLQLTKRYLTSVKSVFPIYEVGMYYHKHHLTAYMMSIGSLEVFYLSTSSSLWELIARMWGHSENYSSH